MRYTRTVVHQLTNFEEKRRTMYGTATVVRMRHCRHSSEQPLLLLSMMRARDITISNQSIYYVSSTNMKFRFTRQKMVKTFNSIYLSWCDVNRQRNSLEIEIEKLSITRTKTDVFLLSFFFSRYVLLCCMYQARIFEMRYIRCDDRRGMEEASNGTTTEN